MRIVFLGTPGFALPSLQALVDAGHQVALVVTQPDRPRGRGQRVRRTEVAALADRLDLPVAQPRRASEPGFCQHLASLNADLFVVVAYGHILKQRLLDIPPLGCINAHASLLPRLRGAAPIQHAIFGGDSRSGVTTMMMDRGMDSGDLLLRREVPIGSRATAGELHDLLAPVAAELLVETLERLDSITPEPQDHRLASFAPRIEAGDLPLDWTLDAATLDRRVRALAPAPGARTWRGGELLKVWEAEPRAQTGAALAPGALLAIDEGCAVQCGRDLLRLLRVGPSGRAHMPATAYLRGRPLEEGERLDAGP